MMEKYLKIAVSKGLEASVPAPYEALLVTPTLELSQLAALVLTKEEAKFLVKEAKRYGLPVFETTPKKARELKADVLQAALAYEQKNVPRFLTDLINYADEHPVSFTTPGHHNGEFYRRHPAGQVFKNFFGEKMLYADVSDTIPELGDTLTHGGTPLEAEQIAAQAFNADKAYFCTNGTTSSNTICATAALTKDDLVLFDRNNHKSLYNSALVMTGAKPVYLKTDRDPLGLIGPLLESELDEAKIRQKVAQIAPEKAKAKRPFRLAVLQLETYDGVFYDAKHLLEKLGPLCDYILFDCAWGGYEQFVPLMKELSPLSLEYGPDDPGILVTQSIHKQQAGLAQTSQILKKDAHLKGQKRYIDHKHFNNAYLKYVTTSYSYPTYASLAVNAFMAASPLVTEWWEETLRLGIEFRKKLLRQSKLFKPLVPREVDGILWEDIPTEELATKLKYWRLLPTDLWHGFSHVGTKEAIISPLKLTVTCPGVDISQGIYTQNGIPGPILGEYLIEKRIIPGKSDLYSTLFFLTPGEDEQSMQTLLAAFLEFEELYLSEAPLEKALPRLVAKYPKRYAGYTLKRLCDEMHAYYSEHQIYHLQQELFLKETLEDYPLTPYEADQCFMRNEGKLYPLDELVGKIALEGVLPYPPGVFIVAPGEKWQALDVAYFKILLGAIERFSGFDPEIQGIYLDKTVKSLTASGYAL